MNHAINWLSFLLFPVLLLAGAGCSGAAPSTPAQPPGTEIPHAGDGDLHEAETLPELLPVSLADGEKLRVVVTTSLIADVVRTVGGDAIELTQLLPTGADPHSYQARPDDMRTLNDAHVVLVNGLHLEEAMQSVFDSLGDIPVVSINVGVETIEFGVSHEEAEGTTADQHAHEEAEGATADQHAHEKAEGMDEHHEHAGVDPHTWMDARNVAIWTDTAVALLSALDPANAETFAANGAAHRAKLAALHEELAATFAAVPLAQRKVVTDHDSLGYLARAYDLTVVGSVIPSLSTLASPSAQELAALQSQIVQEGVKAIFVDTTVNADVAAQIAADTGARVVLLYTGSLSDAAGPASTYVDMMRHNAAQIVAALQR